MRIIKLMQTTTTYVVQNYDKLNQNIKETSKPEIKVAWKPNFSENQWDKSCQL